MNTQKDTMFFYELMNIIKEFQPSVKIIRKWESTFHKILGIILFFTKYKRFSTTIGSTVALSEDHWGDWVVLGHEGVHVLQGKKQGAILHSLLYLFPQVLFVLALGSFFSLWFLLGLLFLLPLPAYFRMKKELEAYKVSVTLLKWKYGAVSPQTLDHIVKNFTGLNYYIMWPWSAYLLRELKKAVHLAVFAKNDVISDQYLQVIHSSLKSFDLIHKDAYVDNIE